MEQKPTYQLQEITAENFTSIALEVFKYQAQVCEPYMQYLSYLKIDIDTIDSLEKIPFLPIQFFKTHQIITEKTSAEAIFLSSGTTGQHQSKHFVTDLSIYESSFLMAFEQFYGAVEDYVVLALLPSYLEREGSSLIYMVNHLIKQSKHSKSGFYLHNLSELAKEIKSLETNGIKTILIGVSFALLDFVEKFPMQLKHTIVMETGGMKGKRKEMIREELHEILRAGFGVDQIHSEYGMTELLSQAYFTDLQKFVPPAWMKVLIRDTEDALAILPNKKSGAINVIDLANINSCAFIATQDLGKVNEDGSFEVLGRFDNSDIRGCNLLIQ